MSRDVRFHVDDICALAKDDQTIGIVDRTHHEIDSHEPLPTNTYGVRIYRHKSLSRPAFKTFLKDGVPPKGFVLVQWQTHPKVELLPEKAIVLLDRPFLTGDIVKRDEQSTMTGTIISTRKTCMILSLCDVREIKGGRTMKAVWVPNPLETEPMLAPEKEGYVLMDIPASELRLVHPYNEGDLVIYKNWCGRIRECFDEITVRLSDNGVVVIKDESQLEPLNGDPSERLSVGSLVKTKKGTLRTGRWIYGAYSPNTQPVGVVVEARTYECQVDWLQSRIGGLASDLLTGSAASPMPELILGLDELESDAFHVYDLTRKPSQSHASDNPTKARSDIDLQGGLRVKFRDLAGACVKYAENTSHGKLERLDRKDTLGYDMNVFTVINTSTEVDVQWNDLSITTCPARDLMPDFAIDDEDAVFPGEIVCTNETLPLTGTGLEWATAPKRVGIVQQVNAADRIASVRWCEESKLAFLESSMTTHIPTTTIGPPSDVVEEVSFYDIRAPESINRRRGDFVLIPGHSAVIDAQSTIIESESPHTGGIGWIGEVVDLQLDGVCVVRLGAAEPVREIQLLTEQTILAFRGADDLADPTHAEDEDAMNFDSDTDDDELDDMDLDIDMEDDDAPWFEEGEEGIPIDEEDDSWSTENDDDDDKTSNTMDQAVDTTGPVEQPTISETTAGSQVNKGTNGTVPQDLPQNIASLEELRLLSFPNAPSPYDIFDAAVPVNHPFAARVAATSASHIKAVQKEHKILRSSSALPEGVYVRTWESRMDLIRVLFVGPLGTPYEYAPFMVDLFLPPTFPNEPPQAFFHSWTAEGAGMQGRVNPNLYEDGKICLSLLGTWQGDDSKGEGWSAGKSTVLQVLVSILGLVLVKEPYYSKFLYNHHLVVGD